MIALALAPAGFASEEHPTQSELESELVCPTCHTTLDESDAPVARQMKAYIRRRIAAGATKSQIENELVAQLGQGVLGVPRKHGFDLLAWVLPLGGIGIGAAAIGGAAWYWSRFRPGQPGDVSEPLPDEPPLAPELERRVDEELARFDA
ncbi:MAG TPA: cytochrome c-type biogenesis protein CcmH [Gaiellaceae bacterium]|jgi:cytochrome c-type biogenesis protein CcmH